MGTLHMELPAGVAPDEAKLVLLARLYELGRLSLGQAAQLSGYSKPTFIELLGKLGIAVIDYPPEELAREVEA